jgi:hypothetical protein
MRRLLSLTALSIGLCVAGSATAQPRPGGPDRGRGDGPDLRRLEVQLEQLNAKLNELEGRLARMQQGPTRKDGPGAERPGDRGPGPGGERPRFAGPGGDRPGFGGGRGPGPGGMGVDRFGPDGPGGMGVGRFGPDDPRGPGAGGPRGPGAGGPGGPGGPRGPGAGGSPDIGRRIDRIINELEQLKRDLQSQRR